MAVVDAVLGILIQKLSVLIEEEVVLLWGVQDDIRKLSNTLSVIKDVLEDAEKRHITSAALTNWLQKLEDAAKNANEVLDKWEKYGRRKPIPGKKSRFKNATHKLLSWLSIKRIILRHQTANSVKDFIVSINVIAEERKFHLSLDFETGGNDDGNLETTSALPEGVYGREADTEKLVDFLLNKASTREKDVTVLAILGEAGIGKTTLAQIIFNDKRVEEHFEERIWVWVSKNFEVKRMISSIIESVTEKNCNVKGFDSLQKRLRQVLGGKKFLLVIDNVWSKNKDSWIKVENLLKCGAKGSSIIVTTSLEPAASIMAATLPIHRLEPLPEMPS